MKPFDPTKPVQTRDGRAARIICTDRAGNDDTIVALITSLHGTESIIQCKLGGKVYFTSDSPADLINIPTKRKIKYWVSIYKDSLHGRTDDKMYGAKDILARKEVEIEFEEGEGL